MAFHSSGKPNLQYIQLDRLTGMGVSHVAYNLRYFTHLERHLPGQGRAKRHGRHGFAVPLYIRIFKTIRSFLLLGNLSAKSWRYFVTLLAVRDSLSTNPQSPSRTMISTWISRISLEMYSQIYVKRRITGLWVPKSFKK